MDVSLRELVRFHHTGQKANGKWDEKAGLQPALLAPYRNLAALRYDYPIVLVQDDTGQTCVHTLSGIVDSVLQEIAPMGLEGEPMRKHCLRLETRIRALIYGGMKGTLAELWDLAQHELVDESNQDGDGSLTENLSLARRAVTVDGRIIDCDKNATAALLEHIWMCVQNTRSQKALQRLDQLALCLSQILEADFQKSDGARTPEVLKGSMGATFDDSFDFQIMSQILKKGSRESSLTDRKRQRIGDTLTSLRTQRLFLSQMDTSSRPNDRLQPRLVFSSCSDAWEAFQTQISEKVQLLKAIATAELEIENRYDESEYDDLLAGFSQRSLSQEDLNYFPSYLVMTNSIDCQGNEKAKLIDVLSSGLPIKVLVETNNILADTSPESDQLSFGPSSQQLATMAVGLNDAFVLQSTSSNLFQARDRVYRGLTYHGPALFSIFSGIGDDATDLPCYLTTACAMQSRAFPTFTYDPVQGTNLAARFDIEDNPQIDLDWPAQHFAYEDEELQKFSENVAVTLADFAACDKRYVGHFARIPKSNWNEGMLSVAEYVGLAEDQTQNKLPYVFTVENDTLHKCIVDDKLIRATRRCRDTWHSLQELGGINNSHALKLLEQERQQWQQEKEQALNEMKSQAVALTTVESDRQPVPEQETVAEAAIGQSEPEEEDSGDQAYIETPRCTTCDECTDLNSRMFAYDDNKQAYIADLSAGTYQQLVEAAEVCQVAIIHPGKPTDVDEPGVSDLVKRAEAFN
jgi:hypothetical protein